MWPPHSIHRGFAVARVCVSDSLPPPWALFVLQHEPNMVSAFLILSLILGLDANLPFFLMKGQITNVTVLPEGEEVCVGVAD